MKHTNYELNIHAESYPELRAAIRQIAEEHGILEQYAITAVVDDRQAEAAPPSSTAVDDQHRPDPEEAQTQADPEEARGEEGAGELTWYHKPDTCEVWQEPDAGRRKGIYKIDEATAEKLQAKYAQEEQAEEAVDDAEEAIDEEQAEEPAPTPTLDQLRQAVMAYAKENGNAKGKALVEKYGASKISEVPQDQWPALMAEAEEGV